MQGGRALLDARQRLGFGDVLVDEALLLHSLFQSDTFFIKVQNAQMTPAIPKWQEPSA